MPVTTELAAQFHQVFAGMSQVYGTYDMSSPTIREGDGKREGRAQTKHAPVTDELWIKHLNGEIGIGIVPIRDDNTCVFGAIDVDVYDGVDHREVAVKLARMQIPMVVCRSKSGGLHIFAFAIVPIPATAMQKKLKDVAAVLGYGTSEIFPKQTQVLVERGDCGSWLNICYEGGVRGMRYAVDVDGNAMSPEKFILHAEGLKQPLAWFESPTILVEDFPEGPPCLQILANIGYPKGSRNDGLYNLGVYLKKSDPDNWENTLDLLNHRYMAPPLSISEVQSVIKSVKRKDYNYGCSKAPIMQHCNAGLCRTRKFGVSGGNAKFPSLGPITKLNTAPAIWFWTVNDVRVELTTQELQDPRRFQLRILETINMFIQIPAAPTWQAAVAHALESVTIIEAPPDASPEGQFWEMVDKFCTGRSQALSREEIVLGRPYTEGNRTFFRLVDLVTFLNVQKFNEFKTSKVASLLRDHGAQHHAETFGGKTCNHWSIPALRAQADPLKVPDSLSRKNPF